MISGMAPSIPPVNMVFVTGGLYRSWSLNDLAQLDGPPV